MFGHMRVKSLLSILFTFIVMSCSQLVMATTLVINNSQVSPDDAISITAGDISGDRDWVGIYRKSDSNDWGNVLSWAWVVDGPVTLSGAATLSGVPEAGEYEARLFFHNSFNLEASAEFNAASIGVSKTNYQRDESIDVTFAGLSGDQDWVGIYRKGDTNDWANVQSWGWANNGSLTLEGIANTGDYEARLFFHNAYALQASSAFKVGATSITASKSVYGSNESIPVSFMGLSGDQDWVGIYHKGDSNDWNNVVRWGWANAGALTLEGIPNVGDYEVRLFFHNSYHEEAMFEISVSDNDDVVIENHEDKNYVVYRPKNNLNNIPIMLVVSYSTVLGTLDDNDPDYKQRFEGLMKYMASKGVYVIGHTRNNGGDSASGDLIPLFQTALTDSLNKYPNLNKSKFGIIGQSRGGGHVFKMMQYFKSQQYGGDKSFVVPFDGSFAHEMSTAELAALHTDSLFIQFGGVVGNITDPRRTLSLNKLLPGDTNKGFITIDTNLGGGWDDHRYGHGNLADFLTKTELVQSINAIIDYEFFDDLDAKEIVFGVNKTGETIQNIIDTLNADPHTYSYACDGHGASEHSNYIYLKDVDYCAAYLN